MTFRTLDNADLNDKRVLLRVDLNVPMENGKITDATRIERVVPTITEIADKGGKVILLSHFGRPKGRHDPTQSLKPVAAEVSRVLGRPVAFAEDCIGKIAEAAISKMNPGDILCLENTRFYKQEEDNDPEFAAKLAKLGDLFVDDAFSVAHRAHASNTSIVSVSSSISPLQQSGPTLTITSAASASTMPAYAGRSMEAELDALSKALVAPKKPVIAIVGGAKVSTKIELLENMIDKVDALVIGGGMANTFLHAQGINIGKSLAERDLADLARRIMAKADEAKCAIILPVDAVVAHEFKANAPSKTYGLDAIPADGMILDVGPLSIDRINAAINDASTLLWNGPLGAFELTPFDRGTVAAARHAAERTKAGKLVSIAGGGDTVAALNQAGVADDFTYISTAGGAFLEFLEGKVLPGVEVLRAK